MGVIGLDIGAYGTFGYASALADFVEFACLSQVNMSRSELEDAIADMDLTGRPRNAIRTIVEQPGEPKDFATQAFDLLRAREKELGDLYPFHIPKFRLEVRPGFPVGGISYVSMLAHSMLHAWKVPSPISPEEVLEEVAEDVLRRMGLSVYPMGTAAGKGFTERFRSACDHLGLPGLQDPTPRPSAAKDLGVDTIAGLVWPYASGLGHWIFVGQVTVETSTSWLTKLKQPDPDLWSRFLGQKLSPQPFLVVPYQVEGPVAEMIMETRRGLLIDRMRLSVRADQVSKNESLLIDTLLSTSLDF